MRIPAVLALATLCTTLALQPAAAQPADAPPAPTPDVGATSLTIGYFNVAFDYASPQNGYAYGFDGPATTLMLSGDAAALSFAWGTTADGVASADSAAPSHQ